MKNLKVIMADRNITGQKLSKDLGVSKTTISSYVRETVQRIDINIMLEIANYFDVTLDELFGRVPYSTKQEI